MVSIHPLRMYTHPVHLQLHTITQINSKDSCCPNDASTCAFDFQIPYFASLIVARIANIEDYPGTYPCQLLVIHINTSAFIITVDCRNHPHTYIHILAMLRPYFFHLHTYTLISSVCDPL